MDWLLDDWPLIELPVVPVVPVISEPVVPEVPVEPCEPYCELLPYWSLELLNDDEADGEPDAASR